MSHDPAELSRGAMSAAGQYLKDQGVDVGHIEVVFDYVQDVNDDHATRVFCAPALPLEHIGCHLANLAQGMGIIDDNLKNGLVQVFFDEDGDARQVIRVKEEQLRSYLGAMGLLDRDEEETDLLPLDTDTQAWLRRLRDIRRSG